MRLGTLRYASRLGRAGLLLFGMAWVGAGLIHASDLVTFQSGESLEVEGFRMEGALIILSIRGGGEIGCPPAQIARVERQPDPPVSRASMQGSLRPERGAPAVSANLHAESLPYISPTRPKQGVQALVRHVARSLAVDPKLLEAMVRVESNYDPFAVSRRGAMGLMQLMPQTAKRFQVDNAFDPAQNLEGGTRYLKSLLARYGEVSLALAAYNAGEGAVDRAGGIPPFRETRSYVRKILSLLEP